MSTTKLARERRAIELLEWLEPIKALMVKSISEGSDALEGHHLHRNHREL